ncbi:BON domain-containing protein [Chitinimonas sp. BJYL2]|uniref:BON domain-containing protein n=1 Tax=Chitinimonas sp. BJYL2 TaxID=2976696 RepID=UPI0022B55735|nr:BON domain-containing protein [Chitinimonas sp. BJYL2]
MTQRLSALLIALLATTQLTACFPLLVAGATTGVVVSQDRRSSSVVVNDEQIEMRVAKNLGARFGSLTHANITSYNRAVLLSGEVPDEATRTEAGRIARETQDVKQVHNELVIAPPSGISGRASDTSLTTRVKARMIDANKFSPVHVKVVSERKLVYLMGLVKQQEGRDAAQIAAQTPGVEKVVTLFEYLD